jgi:arsenate reductase
MKIKIYHNPHCSKSVKTLSLLEEKGISPTIIEYLKTPLSVQELTDILIKMGKRPLDVLRLKEAREEGVDLNSNDKDLIKAIVAHPRTLERPIVVNGNKAVIGRPPKAILNIL